MAKSLDQIISELNSSYQPQVDLLRTRQQAIPGAIKAEETALGAKKDQAYDDILSGARRRGLGFAGIPLGEQAKYAATEYTPALARLRQSGQEQATSLEESILGINERRNTLAQTIYQQERDRDEQIRQFNAQLAEQAAARRAAAASSGGGGMGSALASLFGGGGGAEAPADPYGSVDRARAQNAIHSLLGTGNVGLISKTLKAIQQSAAKGNIYDKYKLELIKAAQTPSKNSAYNGAYANLLKKAQSYKAPTKAPAKKPNSNWITSGQFPTTALGGMR